MNIIQKVKQGATDAAKLAQNKVEITKYKSQVASKEREVERYQMLIGQAVFLSFQAGEPYPVTSRTTITEHCKVIVHLQKDIEALEQQIMNLKREKVCVCGTVISQEAYYCSMCGKKYIGFK
ncbi:hypothetical protein SY83_01750 [Paenibacillus swuensis]|uniref:Zinc ribbon domain-containing protein n=1 Tax=Paenibacillus swuensis TaxID=1178515 RepID=A0A172TEP9_9BACL|nr:hypothetical protein [Paenibacillus swuensis]ANE45263.1 hypothetical protein SY83_01750 [Paenibacillus swuensis]